MVDPDLQEEEEEEPSESWVRIQKDTFTNWINDKLLPSGVAVKNLKLDLRDGVKLCKLMCELKHEKIGKIQEKKNLNQYQAGSNLQLAIKAMEKDEIRLVNIGAEDISGGNLKLILGMCWLLIRRYQIGARSRLPTKKIMLAWINAALHPHLEITNFSSDWNDGVALHGLIEYCKAGSAPNWNTMGHMDRVKNCTDAMTLAQEMFGIPMVVRPENMASGDLDELSGMTYLSYFMAEGGPGYNATLTWVQDTMNPAPITDFTTSWNSGETIVNLVQKLGCTIPDMSNTKPEVRCATALSASQKELGIPPFISHRDILPPNADHIALMAYTAWLGAVTGNRPRATEGYRKPPSPEPPQEEQQESDEEPAPLEDVQEEEPERIVVPSFHNGSYNGVQSDVTVVIQSEWAVDTPLTIHIKTQDTMEHNFKTVALSPHDHFETKLPVMRTGPSIYDAIFTPHEKGTWTIEIRDDEGHHVTGSPYHVSCYDVTKAEIVRHYEGKVPLCEPYSFYVNTSLANNDRVRVHVLHENESLPVDLQSQGDHEFKVTFTPPEVGQYPVSVYVGGLQVPGSPFIVEAERAGDIKVSGEGLHSGQQNHLTGFELDTCKYPDKPLDILISGPGGQCLEPEITTTDHIIKVNYVPPVPGFYKIEVTYNNVPVAGSPFRPEYTGAQVTVRGIPENAKVGKTYAFSVDASQMAKGTLEIDSDLPVLSYEKEGEKKYRVTFVPKKSGTHDLVVKYNGIPCAESPYAVNVNER